MAMWLASSNAPFPFSKLDKFRNSDTWRGKRWFPADPANEIPMLETMVRRGWCADQDIAAELGYGSFRENVDKTKQDDRDAAGTDVAQRNAPKAGAPAPTQSGKDDVAAKEKTDDKATK
jgi:hypothetical protein